MAMEATVLVLWATPGHLGGGRCKVVAAEIDGQGDAGGVATLPSLVDQTCTRTGWSAVAAWDERESRIATPRVLPMDQAVAKERE